MLTGDFLPGCVTQEKGYCAIKNTCKTIIFQNKVNIINKKGKIKCLTLFYT